MFESHRIACSSPHVGEPSEDVPMKLCFATLTAGLALVSLTGCTETTSSKNIKTGGIAALIEVTATSESSSAVKATLKVGGDESNTYVDLDGTDRIYASA